MTVRINNQIPLYILILILFFSSCKGDQSPIDEKSMVDILVDLHIAQAAKVRDRVNMRSWESYPYYNYVCQKHHVTKVELDSALSFYSKNEEQYQLLYEKVVDEINRIETEVSSGIYAAEFAKPSINQFGIDSVMFAMDTAITDSIITEIWPFKREYAFNDTTTFRFDIENRAQKQQRFLFKCNYQLLASDKALKAGFRSGIKFADASIKSEVLEFEKGQKDSISVVLETTAAQRTLKLFFEFIDLTYREPKLQINLSQIRLYQLDVKKIEKNEKKIITALEFQEEKVLTD